MAISSDIYLTLSLIFTLVVVTTITIRIFTDYIESYSYTNIYLSFVNLLKYVYHRGRSGILDHL